MTIPDAQVFEDAIGQLWSGQSKDREGQSEMFDAVLVTASAGEGDWISTCNYLLSWLRPGREFDEAFPSRPYFGTRARQESRALFLTLMAELAERGEEAP